MENWWPHNRIIDYRWWCLGTLFSFFSRTILGDGINCEPLIFPSATDARLRFLLTLYVIFIACLFFMHQMKSFSSFSGWERREKTFLPTATISPRNHSFASNWFDAISSFLARFARDGNYPCYWSEQKRFRGASEEDFSHGECDHGSGKNVKSKFLSRFAFFSSSKFLSKQISSFGRFSLFNKYYFIWET